MVDSSTATSSDGVNDNLKSSQFVGFLLEDQRYAFRIEKIREIVILDQLTPTPQVSDCVEGVSNLRGEIIPIVNLRKLLGLTPKPTDGETRTIVVSIGDQTIGCTVDSVSQVMRINDEAIQPAPDTVAAAAGNYITGFAKLDDGLVILLDSEQLLHPDRLLNQ
jgi:purine-binding chemotaxis protein CheW